MPRGFGWGWQKGGRAATEIVVRHVVSIVDIRDILRDFGAYWLLNETDPLPTLGVRDIERIVRKSLSRFGDGYAESPWPGELLPEQLTLVRDWAVAQVRAAWPVQSEWREADHG